MRGFLTEEHRQSVVIFLFRRTHFQSTDNLHSRELQGG